MNTNEHELFVKKYKPGFNRHESVAYTILVFIRLFVVLRSVNGYRSFK